MSIRYATLPALLLALTANAQQTCSTALPVTLGIHAVAAVDGMVLDAPRCTNNDQGPATHAVWYAYTALNSAIVQIATDVQGQPQVDTRFHVYSGSCQALACVVGNDNGGLNGTSRATFDAVEGETYLIAFDDRWSAAAFSFKVEETFYPLGNAEDFTAFTPFALNLQGNPFAIVDMDNDGLDDAVAVTPNMVNIQYQEVAGGYRSVVINTEVADYPASWSLCAGDLDGNGHKDLVYGGQFGVTFMFATDDGAAFIKRAGPEYVFSQRSNMVDINNDGHLDAFVCHDVAPNVFYLNNGAGMFQFVQGGLGYSGGNYGSIWVDYDSDGDVDLYVAKCGSDPNDLLFRNDGNGVFVQVTGPLGQFDYHQSWSSAWGDYDNDGDMDVLVGSSVGPDHFLMRNDGAAGFTNVTAGSGMDRMMMQSVEWVTHDFNNDGLVDILGGGMLMINLGGMRFAQNSASPGVGAVGDLNSDGSLDLLGYMGLQFGVPNGNHWLRVALNGTVSNDGGIGARVIVESALGTQIRDVRAGDGFRYMSSSMPHFGLGTDETIDRVIVRWPSGIEQELVNVDVDQLISITEPLNTAVVESAVPATMIAYPNPATDRLHFVGLAAASGTAVRLVDLSGRIVGERTLHNGSISVAGLAPGLYSARMVLQGTTQEVRFQKD